MHLRAKTLSELHSTLEDSYFTGASFKVEAKPNGFPFLDIIFIPSPQYRFQLYEEENSTVRSEESPGLLLSTGEERRYKSLSEALNSVAFWTRRIKEEYQHAAKVRTEVDEFLERFREKVFVEDDGRNPAELFSLEEITDLRQSLDKLKTLVAEQGEALKANDLQIRIFEREIEQIKSDLEGMPRGVWKKVASSKLLKSVKGFLGTSEGRALIADGLKKLIGLE